MIGKANSSFIIITKDRYDDIVECIKSILGQTILPIELIIVDASKTKKIRSVIRNLLNKQNINFVYIYSKPGTGYQRNLGIRKAKGDIIFFFDDDVILDENYHQEVLNVYRSDRNKKIGGVGGVIKNFHRFSKTAKTYRKLFFLPTGEGNDDMLPSGSPNFTTKPKNIKEVRVLSGCNMSYRKDVLKDFKFDESLGGYALGEDADLSYRVSHKYKLVVTPFAKLEHKVSGISRITTTEFEEKHIVNSYYFFKKNIPQTNKNKIYFLWSRIGLIIHSIVQAIKYGDFGWIMGMLKGFWKTMKEKKAN